MSTSLLYHAFGLRGYQYVRTVYEAGQVRFAVRQPRKAWRCSACGSRSVRPRGAIERRFRSLPIGRRPVTIDFAIPRVACSDCGAIRQVALGFADARRSYTKAFERYALDLSRHMTIRAAAEHLGVGWDVIKDIQKRDLHRRFARPKLGRLRRIAIDEIAVGRRRFLTVVLDLDSGAAVFVGDGKGGDALKPFWRRLRRTRAKVEAVAIDMSPAYRRATAEQKAVLKGSRWLLLKNPENLDPERDEAARLEEALKLNASLAVAYYLKEDLRRFWEQADKATAAVFLADWIARARASGVGMLSKMADTLEGHRDGLLAYYDHRISTGPLEGTNNKIKTMKRQAYGFRDREFFKLKILAIHEATYALVG